VEGSVTRLIRDCRAGSEPAAVDLWQRLNERLLRLATKRMPRRGGLVDPEDIAVDAYYSFLRRHRQGEFPELSTRDDAWRMLFVIVIRKTVNAIRHSMRQRRNPENNGATGFIISFSGRPRLMAGPVSQDPCPATEVLLAESVTSLLALLPDQQLQDIAQAKVEGFTNPEVAEKLGCSLATVERRLKMIRLIWEKELTE
jgi:DNA-directed RNA polymerase specialized sigma24 family protein